MHAYGYSRSAKIACKFGCCQRRDTFKEASARVDNDRARRKAARQAAKRGIFTDLLKEPDNV
jgi:hypothetical protein